MCCLRLQHVLSDSVNFYVLLFFSQLPRLQINLQIIIRVCTTTCVSFLLYRRVPKKFQNIPAISVRIIATLHFLQGHNNLVFCNCESCVVMKKLTAL